MAGTRYIIPECPIKNVFDIVELEFFFHPRMEHVFRRTTRDYRSWCMNYEYSPVLLQPVCKYILLRDECVYCVCVVSASFEHVYGIAGTPQPHLLSHTVMAPWKCENKNKLQVLSITLAASARAKNENRNSGEAQKKSAWRQSINFMTIITLKLYIYHAIFCEPTHYYRACLQWLSQRQNATRNKLNKTAPSQLANVLGVEWLQLCVIPYEIYKSKNNNEMQ